MTIVLNGLMGLWAGFYLASLAVGLWRQENRRGAVLTAVLAAGVVLFPPFAQWILLTRQ